MSSEQSSSVKGEYLWLDFGINAYSRYIGYLATHERFFLGLDTLPLFLGITVYTYFWPGRYLRYDLKKGDMDMERTSQDGSATTPQHGTVEEQKITGPTVV